MNGLFELLVAEVDLGPPPLPPGEHTLITLEQASWLPELGGHVDVRAIWRAADTLRLQTTQPTGRRLYTTRAWIAAWIQDGCRDRSKSHASHTTRTETVGSSPTPASRDGSVGLSSLEARLLKLRSS